MNESKENDSFMSGYITAIVTFETLLEMYENDKSKNHIARLIYATKQNTKPGYWAKIKSAIHVEDLIKIVDREF